jgi:Cell division control protein 24, OB domain 1
VWSLSGHNSLQSSSADDSLGGAGISWGWVAVELVALLQQFPMGVSTAIIFTQLQSQWQIAVRSGVVHGQRRQRPQAAAEDEATKLVC